MAKMIKSPAQAGWQIDLNSRLRNSDQIDSVTSVGSVRVKKTLYGSSYQVIHFGEVVNSSQFDQ